MAQRVIVRSQVASSSKNIFPAPDFKLATDGILGGDDKLKRTYRNALVLWLVAVVIFVQSSVLSLFA